MGEQGSVDTVKQPLVSRDQGIEYIQQFEVSVAPSPLKHDRPCSAHTNYHCMPEPNVPSLVRVGTSSWSCIFCVTHVQLADNHSVSRNRHRYTCYKWPCFKLAPYNFQWFRGMMDFPYEKLQRLGLFNLERRIITWA